MVASVWTSKGQTEQAAHTDMKEDIKRFWRRGLARLGKSELERATPLVHLVHDVEPDPDLLARIEAELDEVCGSINAGPPPAHRMLMVLGAFAIGCLIGLAAATFLHDRQHIIARTDATAPWVSMGSVSLKGQSLRSFVAAKCEGYAYFTITMHGFGPDIVDGPDTTGQPLIRSEEKILMECIH